MRVADVCVTYDKKPEEKIVTKIKPKYNTDKSFEDELTKAVERREDKQRES